MIRRQPRRRDGAIGHRRRMLAKELQRRAIERKRKREAGTDQ